MKIDRRSFLSLVAGGAVGTALTPLPLKLMDDSSIWAQSFKYTPIEVPVPADGASHYKDTVCTLCPGGCGLSVRKIDKRAIKIEGRADYPVNNGSVCGLGLSGLQLLYGPWRVPAPMKKENNAWKKITWSQALTEISQKLTELRDNKKAATIAGILPENQGTVAHLMKRFITACGSPNVFSRATDQDAQAIAVKKLLGQDAAPGFDFENSSFVLSFSSGLLDGWGSPVRMAQANSLWKDKGATLVQVEPRLSHTAMKANQWVPINPGTEADLALGLAHIIIREYLHDRRVTEAAQGFDAFVALLNKEYTPAQVAQKTKVAAETIEKLARQFAKAPNSVAVCGRGNGRQPVSVREATAVLALNVLVGNLNRRGGVTTDSAPDYIDWTAPVLDAAARQGLSQPRADGAAADMPGRLHRLPEMVNKNKISALLVAEANPAYTLHNAPAVEDALKKISLVVCLSTYMDETAALADYVLPLTTGLERTEDIAVTAGLKQPLVAMSQPVVKPQGNTRHPGNVIIELADKMGGSVAQSFPWSDYADCLETTLGEMVPALKRQGFVQKTDQNLALTAPAVNFAALTTGMKALPDTSQPDKAYPLTLVPYDSMRLAEDNIGTPPFALKTVSNEIIDKQDVLVAVNPATARQFNLSEGKAVTLTTPAGSAKVKVHLSEGVAREIVAMPRGLGHTAYDDYLAGKGVNINTLVAPIEDPVSGLDVAWGIRAKLA